MTTRLISTNIDNSSFKNILIGKKNLKEISSKSCPSSFSTLLKYQIAFVYVNAIIIYMLINQHLFHK